MSKATVLVVEDDKSMAAMLKATLPQYEVVICTEKAHAIKRAKEYLLSSEKPDIILIDLIINGEGGLDFYQWLHDKGFKIPVMFLTGCHPNSPEFVAAQDTGEFVYEKDKFSSKALATIISTMVVEEAC